MAADIVPALFEKIQSEFDKQYKSNRKIRDFLAKLDKGAATAKEVSLYAEETGKCASGALCKYLTDQYLPDGKLYWNIADRTIRPLLRNVWELVTDAAETQQKAADKAAGININAAKGAFPEGRIHRLIEKLLEYRMEEEQSGNEI